MVLKPDQERVKTLLQDTITLLCRNGLNYKSEFNVSALIGITLDKDEVFLVDIRETVKNNTKDDEDSGEENGANDNEVDSPTPSHKKHKKRRKRSHSAMSDGESATSDSVPGTPISRVKPEEDDSNSDAIIIKDEPDYDHSHYGQNDILGDLAQQGQLYAAPSSLPGASTWDHSSQQAVSSLPSQQSSAASASMSSPLQPQQGVLLPRFTASAYLRVDGYHCPYCPYTCKADSSFSYHMMRHEGRFPFYCPYCNEGKLNSLLLKTHMKEHTGRFGCFCNKCGMDAGQLKALKKHLTECQGGGGEWMDGPDDSGNMIWVGLNDDANNE